MRIYAGNLSYELSEGELSQEFAEFGTVDSVTVPSDSITGRPKGFAFIDMPSRSEAEAAIAGLNGKELKGRTIVVNEARPRTERGGGYGGGRGSGGYGGGGRGGRQGGRGRR